MNFTIELTDTAALRKHLDEDISQYKQMIQGVKSSIQTFTFNNSELLKDPTNNPGAVTDLDYYLRKVIELEAKLDVGEGILRGLKSVSKVVNLTKELISILE
jgi:hypothetical protein